MPILSRVSQYLLLLLLAFEFYPVLVQSSVAAPLHQETETAPLLLSEPWDIAVESDGHLAVLDQSLDAVMRVDPDTGRLSLVSGRGRGNGPDFFIPKGLAIEKNDHLVVIDGDVRGGYVFRVNPTTGDRSLVSGLTRGDGPALEDLQGIAVEANGSLVLVDGGAHGLQAVIRVDPVTGNRIIVSGCNMINRIGNCPGEEVGDGPAFVRLRDIAVEANGSLLVLEASFGIQPSIMRVEPRTGDRTIISGCARIGPCSGSGIIGNGPGFGSPADIAMTADGHIVVVDTRYHAIMRVDPNTGDRTIISGCLSRLSCNNVLGSGPRLRATFGAGIAVEAEGNLVVTDRSLNAVLRVEPDTGDRSIVVQSGRGSGFALEQPEDINTDNDGNFVVVDLGAVVRIDAVTGNRILVSGGADFIGSGPSLTNHDGIVVEADGHIVIGANSFPRDAPLRVDPVTGNRNTITPIGGRGSGLAFKSLEGIAVATNGSFVVTDLTTVVRVNPDTGDRTVVSGCSNFALGTIRCTGDMIGTGPSLRSPRGIVLESDGHLVVIDRSLEAVVRVDPNTGNRTVLTGGPDHIGGGPPIEAPLSIALESDGHLVVTDVLLKGVVRVDPVTGDRTLVTGGPDNLGSGPPLESPRGIALESNGHLVVIDASLDGVVRVDPVTGDRTLVASDFLGSFGSIVVESDGHFVVTDAFFDGVVRVDPVTGDHTVISSGSDNIGSGPGLVFPTALALETDGHIVIVDRSFASVVRINPETGDRTVVSGGRSGFVFPTALTLDADDHIVVADSEYEARTAAIVRVDPVTGDRTVVSGGAVNIGSGPQLDRHGGIAVEANGHLLVVDSTLNAVVRVDPATGDRTVVSGNGRGSGPALVFPSAVALEANGNLVLVMGCGETIVRVALDTGERTAISGCSEVMRSSCQCIGDLIGNGRDFDSLSGIVVEANGDLVVVDRQLEAVLRIDPVTGDRTLVSQ